MRVDDLYTRITEAISRAETLEEQGRIRDAAVAYHEVSHIEEEIAELLPAGEPEGALARQGVVTAAISAGDLVRAIEYARVYVVEDELAPAFKDELESLRHEAEEKLHGTDETASRVLPDAT